MNRTLYTLFLLILFGIIHSYPSRGAAKLNVQAKKVMASIRMPISFQAGFVYTHIQRDAKQENTQEEYQIEGKLWVKGNKYRLILEDQIVVSNGKTIWNYVPSLQEVQIHDEIPATADKNLTSFSPIQLLRLYEQGFVPIALHVPIIDQKKCDVIELIAPEEKSEIRHLNLVIDQESHQIKSMQVLEKDGTVHNFSLVDLVVHNKLQNTYFEFQMPAEPVEVVDLR